MTHSGGKPHLNVGDKGQRWEVSYYDPDEVARKIFGWAETIEGADRLANSIKLHPSMSCPRIKDRSLY